MSGMMSFPGIDVPDVFERGLPTALANLLKCWWADDGRGVDSWLANVAQRLWLSGVWDERIDERTMHGNRARIVRLAADALDEPNRWDDDRWARLLTTIGRLTHERDDATPEALRDDKAAERMTDIADALSDLEYARMHDNRPDTYALRCRAGGTGMLKRLGLDEPAARRELAEHTIGRMLDADDTDENPRDTVDNPFKRG